MLIRRSSRNLICQKTEIFTYNTNDNHKLKLLLHQNGDVVHHIENLLRVKVAMLVVQVLQRLLCSRDHDQGRKTNTRETTIPNMVVAAVLLVLEFQLVLCSCTTLIGVPNKHEVVIKDQISSCAILVYPQ